MRIDMSKAVSAEIPRSKKLASCIVAASQVEFSLIQNYLIKRWIDNDAISMVYGDSNCGKSFFALDMAFHVAAGVRWQEQRVKQGKVLYVAAEGGRGFSKRVKALEKAKPELYEAGKDHLFLLPLQVDLHAAEDPKASCASGVWNFQGVCASACGEWRARWAAAAALRCARFLATSAPRVEATADGSSL